MKGQFFPLDPQEKTGQSVAMSLVKIQQEGGILEVALNRPEKRNALNKPLMEELLNALKKPCSVLILRGEGKVFCAGLDLKEQGQDELVGKVLSTLYHLPCVTIAAVQGAAIAGGAGLMCACDLAVAHQDALFGFPEVRRGLVPAQVMSCLIRKLLPKDIRELTLLGELVNAERAKELGLLNGIAEDDVREKAYEMAEIVLKGAPNALKETKKLILEMENEGFSIDLKKAFPYHKRARQSDEAKEGLRAFLEGRSPKW